MTTFLGLNIQHTVEFRLVPEPDIIVTPSGNQYDPGGEDDYRWSWSFRLGPYADSNPQMRTLMAHWARHRYTTRFDFNVPQPVGAPTLPSGSITGTAGTIGSVPASYPTGVFVQVAGQPAVYLVTDNRTLLPRLLTNGGAIDTTPTAKAVYMASAPPSFSVPPRRGERTVHQVTVVEQRA